MTNRKHSLAYRIEWTENGEAQQHEVWLKKRKRIGYDSIKKYALNFTKSHTSDSGKFICSVLMGSKFQAIGQVRS